MVTIELQCLQVQICDWRYWWNLMFLHIFMCKKTHTHTFFEFIFFQTMPDYVSSERLKLL